MRILFGMILGACLTIGFAYMYDASATNSSEQTAQTSGERKPMVNWDVVSVDWHEWSASVRNTWNKLAAR
jgi:hypothetical protein